MTNLAVLAAVVGCATLGAITSVAGPTTLSAPAETAPPKNARLDPNATVCKHVEVTGSRLQGSKVCKTRQEWRDYAEEARRATESRQNQSSLVPDSH